MSISLRDHPFRLYYGPADDPLNNFYVPALSASVQYDRSAGFFNSSALAVAAAGVARLIQNGGRMRLLVGAALDENDVHSIERGHDLKTRLTERLLERFADPQDALLRQRLEVLAWMVAEGTLEIKVVLPRDERGLPIPSHLTHDYYHPKSGIFTDANGDRLAFTGSVNESETAWRKNYEEFLVCSSWGEGQFYLLPIADRFDRLWQGQEADWIALDIPHAVRDHLLQYRPPHAPEFDPLERRAATHTAKNDDEAYTGEVSEVERRLFQFVRDAPFLPNAIGLGAATAAIIPWPHQTQVANAIIQRFPDRAMLCDEVGLGKTIEAGLVIRQLLLSGRVKRCLILAPKSVLKQWQQELYEKFALDVPRYDNNRFVDVRDQPLPTANGTLNVWEAFDVMLVGSQLAKRADRRSQFLAARAWDLIVVDEAHHARRKDFKERIYRPNRLLGLLSEMKERDKFASLLLMTATPMQVHPVEVWDLLTLLGMGGKWGADEDNFLDFFRELRQPFAAADWEVVFDLVQDYLSTGGQLDESFKSQALTELGPVKWSVLEDLPRQTGQRARLIRQVGGGAQPYVKELARRHTPLNHYVFRSTRALLRDYRKRGILRENVPTRDPHRERISLRPEEQALYDRIEEYISRFYQKYERERRGLGFVMTVYRRRLTSSFWAIRCSLERRLDFLRGLTDDAFDDDDLEQDDLEQDVAEDLLNAADRERFKAELDYVEDFIQQLRVLGGVDSKTEWLTQQLAEVFRTRSTALVFTQYTDTLDYLREQLCEVYGSGVACYSGRGGEVWNGIAWVTTTKEDVKSRFREGTVRILLCTESASEGLNLQTCGVLINYDMPWNPMRVEQRIGRIDRIGQQHDMVWIRNYFYRDTIEDLIYERLADRIDWFEVVVGDLQPILAEVGEVTRRLAMASRSEREIALEHELDALRQRLQNREVEALNLDQFLQAEQYVPGPTSPVRLIDLETLLTTSQTTQRFFQQHPEIDRAYLFSWHGEVLPVTFSRECVDAHPDTVRFLSYGSPLLTEILESVPEPDDQSGRGTVRCQSGDEITLRAWYEVDAGGQPRPIETFIGLQDVLSQATSLTSTPDIASVNAQFAQEVQRVKQQQATVLQHRRLAQYLAVRAKAQRVLIKAALVEIALGQQPDLFDKESYPATFSVEAVRGLQRHGFPWRPLLALAFEESLSPRETDAYYQTVANDKRDEVRKKFSQLQGEARSLVQVLKQAQAAAASSA